MPVAPLVLSQCVSCGLAQLAHTVDRSVLFGNTYPYKSGMNQTVRDHLKGIVDQALSLVDAKPGDLMLDIGSNDGTLLSLYPKKYVVMGVEPSERLAQEARRRGIPTYNSFFPMEWPLWKKSKVITSIAIFYDLEDPLAFCKAISDILDRDGIWVNEFNYLSSMVENLSFDQIGHEHLCYYSFNDIVRIYTSAGLEIFHAETNPINGGSLRVLACHQWKRPEYLKRDFLNLSLVNFTERVERRILSLRELLASRKGSVWIRGASTRGLTLLHTLGMHSRFDGAGDRNPEKWGCYIPGTSIQIHSEAEVNAKADYQLLLPYTYLDEILSRSQDFLARGGKFIIPVPEPRLKP